MPISQCTASVVAGILVGCAGGALWWRPRPASNRRTPARNGFNRVTSPIQRRLAEGEARLERLDAERARRADASLGRTTEERIVWRELLELELQEIDEQVSRIQDAAGRMAG